MERILVILDKLCALTQRRAVESACYPDRIRVEVGDFAAAQASHQGEDFIFFVPSGTDFARHWDLSLPALWRRLKEANALLTGYLPRETDPHGPLPVAAEGFDEQGRLCLGPGAPLNHCARPQPAAFLHPHLLFGSQNALKQLWQQEGPEPLFIKAFAADLPAYTLNVRLFTHPQMPSIPPQSPWAPFEEDTPLSRFEEEFGLRWDSRRLSAHARLGLWGEYPLRPGPLRIVHEALRRHRLRKQPAQPLLVTAWREMACAVPSLPGEYESRFRHLARLTELPLMVYAGESDLRRIQQWHHNVYAYRHRYGLPIEKIWEPEEDFRQFLAGKVFLLQRSLNAQPHYTHYGWINFGYQRWPLYPRTAFDWQPLCDERTHLARVKGKLDPSLIMIPREQLPVLCGEILKAARDGIDAGALPEEAALWEAVIARRPELFTLHDLSRPRQLLRLCLGHKEETL